MKLKLLIGLAVVAILTATCKKTFTSIPQLTFKSVSTTNVPHNGSITWTFQFTDAEGDLAGVVGILKTSSSPCAGAGFIDTTKYTMPVIPPSDDSKGTLTVFLPYDQLKTAPCNGADSVEQATFRFWIYDAAGHVSDTATSPTITIHKQ
jgi:hypothetical protein